MQLDLTTLHITQTSSFLLMALMLCTLGWRYRHERSLMLWGIASLLAGTGQLLVAAREHLPAFVAVLFGNGMIFAATAISWLGLLALDRKRLPWGLASCFCGLPLLLMLLAGLDIAFVNQRVVIFVSTVLVFHALLLHALLRSPSSDRPGYRLLTVVVSLIVMMYGYRLMLALTAQVDNIQQSGAYLGTMFVSFLLELARVLLYVFVCFERLEVRLQAMGQLDASTGLPNLRAFRAKATEILVSPANQALVLICPDGLHKMREVSGLQACEKLLADIASPLRQLAQEAGTCYGRHEDGFCMLLPADRVPSLLAGLSGELAQLPHLGRITLGAGVTLLDEGDRGQEVGQLLLEAELALQEAQAAGRGQICYADKEAIRALSEV